MAHIAILIPCYNEAQTIGKVVRDCLAQKTTQDITVYVYDNNSTDHTDDIAREAGAVVRYEYKQGKGNVIRRMFREVEADCYIMLDGDDTYHPQHIEEMANLVLEQGVDMVVGDRLNSSYFTENKRMFHNFGNVFVRKFVNTVFKSDIQDIMTGYRAFSPAFVKTFPVLSRGFEIETEMSIHAIDKNMFVKNVVVEYSDRPEGSESKLNTISDGLRVIRMMMRLFRNYKPLTFFSILAVLLLVLATVVFFPVVWLPYLKTGLVANFPTLIVCGFVTIAALLCYITGLILDTIVQNQKREFEFRLQQVHMLGAKKENADGRL